MLTLELTQEQIKKFEALLDMTLKVNGLEGLPLCVELFNLLRTAKPVTLDEFKKEAVTV